MLPSRPHTVGAAAANQLYPDEEEEDAEFCVVCPGECTCGPSRATPAPAFQTRIASSPSPNPARAPALPLPTLKIKFSAGLLSKARVASTKPKPGHKPSPSTSAGALRHSLDSGIAKKRGRPTKAVLAAREAARSAAGPSTSGADGPSQHVFHLHSSRPHAALNRKKNTKLPLRSKLQAKGLVGKKSAPLKKKKKAPVVPWAASSSSELSDLDPSDDEIAGDVAPQYPTFVSASVVSSSADDSSDSASTVGSDSDASMEAEEEDFIIAEESRQRARVRRELLGDDAAQKQRDHQNNWEIKPRMRSVGLDDVEMDVDSGVETDDDEDEDEDEEMDDGEEEEDTDATGAGAGFVGVATGWSEDEESSFDAELFFANLSSQDSSSSEDEAPAELGPPAPLSPVADRAARERANRSLELTHGWDGEMMFTTDVLDGFSVSDVDFAQFFGAPDSASDVLDTDDAQLSTSEADDHEHEDEDGADEEEHSDGETTEEELVDSAGLPTPLAMQLFRWPAAVSAVSAVNPLSTVSPQVRRHDTRGDEPRSRGIARPVDVLAGRFVFDNDSDEHDNDDGVRVGRARSTSWASSSRGSVRVPPMGRFDVEEDSPVKSAVIDDLKQGVPSPFPRRRASRVRRPLSTAASHRRTLSDGSHLSFHLDSSDQGSSGPVVGINLGEPIELADVLDASILATDLFDSHDLASSVGSDGAEQQPTNLERWDFVPINYFRQTRESSGLLATPSSSWAVPLPHDGSPMGALKESPFSSMTWPSKTTSPSKQSQRGAPSNIVVSPVLLPVRDRERTPTPAQQQDQGQGDANAPALASRKEARREKRKQRRTSGQGVRSPTHAQAPHPRHHQHHQHHHHANGKSRVSGAMQRTNFFGGGQSSVPPFNL